MSQSFQPRYVVISPVKDEARYVERTLQSVAAQTLKPALWIIVDDGSVDRTSQFLREYADQHSFIRIVRRESGARQPGHAIIRAFNAGYESLNNADYDFIVKLDCDLSFPPDYFEQILLRFQKDPALGIASGVYFEPRARGTWEEIRMPAYHAAGACKVVRRECFEQIGGFVASRGWDTVDEIRAINRRWKTTHFRDLKMNHWKIEGAGIGQWRTSLMHGEIYYLTGGGGLFFLFKVLHRACHRPYLIGALGLFLGYLNSLLRRKQRLVNAAEARCYSALLNARITGSLHTPVTDHRPQAI